MRQNDQTISNNLLPSRSIQQVSLNHNMQNLQYSYRLSVGFLNVCSLTRRIDYHEFTDFIQKYDIICFAETKLDDTDVISCCGYTFFIKPRKDKYLSNLDGLRFLVRENICKHVKFVDFDFEYIAWLKIRKSFQHQNDDIIIRSDYIPSPPSPHPPPPTQAVPFFQ